MLLPEKVWEPLLSGDGKDVGKPEKPGETLATSGENNYKNHLFICQPPGHKNKFQTFQRSTGLFLLHSEKDLRLDDDGLIKPEAEEIFCILLF